MKRRRVDVNVEHYLNNSRELIDSENESSKTSDSVPQSHPGEKSLDTALDIRSDLNEIINHFEQIETYDYDKLLREELQRYKARAKAGIR